MKLSMQSMTTMGGDDLSRPHQRNGCEFATPMIFSPKKMSPIIVMMTIAMITMTMMIKSQTLILGAD